MALQRIELDPNVAQVLALQYPTGKVSDRGRWPSMFYTLSWPADCCLYVPEYVGREVIDALGLQPGEYFYLLKRVTGRRNEKPTYQAWRYAEGERPPAAPPPPPPPQGETTLERQLRSSLDRAVPINGGARRAAPPPPQRPPLVQTTVNLGGYQPPPRASAQPPASGRQPTYEYDPGYQPRDADVPPPHHRNPPDTPVTNGSAVPTKVPVGLAWEYCAAVAARVDGDLSLRMDGAALQDSISSLFIAMGNAGWLACPTHEQMRAFIAASKKVA